MKTIHSLLLKIFKTQQISLCTFLSEAQRIVELTHVMKRYRTEANYLTALHALQNFATDKQCASEPLTSELMYNFQRWLLINDKSLNTVSAYARALRAIYNKVYPDGPPLFGKMFTGTLTTRKRAITAEELYRLRMLELTENNWLRLSRDIFLFSFYCMGMPFIDLAMLRWTQIKGTHLVYARHKTGQRIEIALLPEAKEIIDRWSTAQSKYVFPFLKEDNEQALYQQYASALAQYNRALRQLGALIHAEVPLSSYTVRHTWASLAYQHNVDLNIISQAMGHHNSRTTRIYIQEINAVNVANANRQLWHSIFDSAQ